MDGGAWSCFARLPTGLADQSVTLTLNWLKPRPLLDEFELQPDEVEGPARTQILRRRALSVVLGVFLMLGLVALPALDASDQFAVLTAQSSMVALWVAGSVALIAFTLFAQTSVAEARYRRAAPRRDAYEEAARRFGAVAAWRRTRAETGFWSNKLDEAGFEREVAELLAGHFRTGQVMVTRASDDYGVDVLICAGHRRIVAQCKQWKGRPVGATEVRALAGAKAYFGADLALLVTLSGPTEDKAQCAEIAEAQSLELWDVSRIAAAAKAMQDD